MELLRIVAMLLVLLIHYVPTRVTPSTSSLQSDLWGTILNLELRSISFVCVNCFILISGYFSIKWKIKSFGNLIFQILFWLAVGFGLNRIAGWEYASSSTIEICQDYFKARWFVSAYICL